MKLYPFDMPAGVHPLGWALLGYGLSTEQINHLSGHLFDDLGCRVSEVDPTTVEMAWAVSWPRASANDGRSIVEVGDSLDVLVPGAGGAAVQLVGGALPPGIQLVKHTGHLVGSFETAGLYSATLRIGPAVKYDPMGGSGGPDSVGQWIPYDSARSTVDAGEVPSQALTDLSPMELEDLIMRARAAQSAQLTMEAE